MTNLTKYAVLTAALSILSASCLMPSAHAQATGSTTTTTTTAAEKPAPHKSKAAKRRNARKKAKLKSDASKVIEKGVDKAGANLTK